MIRSVSRPSKLSVPVVSRGTDDELIHQNKRLREEITDLKNLNFQYTSLLNKTLTMQYSQASTFSTRELKLANINNYQKELILKLKEQIQGYRDKEAEIARINGFLKSKPFRSIEDMFSAYEALTGEVGKKKTFIESLEGTISSLKKELEDEGEMAQLRAQVAALEEKNIRNELKCERLMKEMEQGIKSANTLKIQSFNTEIKLRELELKDQRTERILSQRLFGTENSKGSTRQKSRGKKK